jgi:hypothetical protein
MRAAVLFYADRQREKLREHAAALARGIEEQGHHVDLVDGTADVNTGLTIYGYIAIGTVSTGMIGGKIPGSIGKHLAGAGMVTGKRSFAFTLKGLGSSKTLHNLMKAMEHEGMFLKYSKIFESEEEALETGRQLHIE